MRTLLVGSIIAAMVAAPGAALSAQSDTTTRSVPPVTSPPPAQPRAEMRAGIDTQPSSSITPNVVNAIRIASIGDDGSYLTLQDGTVWEVYLPDRTRTAEWRSGDAVIVSFAPIMIGASYRFVLTNGRADSHAQVKFRGQVETTGS